MDTFDKHSMNTPINIEEIKKIPIVFIVGKGRSGTTLLMSLLNNHPNIVAPPENKFMLLNYTRFSGIKKWSEKDVFSFMERLFADPTINKGWKLDKEKLTQLLLSIREHLNYSTICKMVYLSYGHPDKQVFLIAHKVPLFTLFLKKIHWLFPEAKFIHIVRDPRDNCLSHKKAFQAKNTMNIVNNWVGYNKIIEADKLKYPDKYFTVLYEKLAANTEDLLKELCGFLNVPYANSMKFVKKEETIKTYQDLPKNILENVHKNLLNPVNISSIGKWKDELTSQDKDIVEAVAGDYARKYYGYGLDADSSTRKKISFFEFYINGKLKYFAWKVFTRFRYKYYGFNLFYSKWKKRIMKDKFPFADMFWTE